jgi:hypothetical protein
MKYVFFLVVYFCLSQVGCQEKDNSISLVSRLHTISIHIREFEIHKKIYKLLKDDLQLPAVYQPVQYGERMYAAVSAGNVYLEPCGPYSHINYTTMNFNAIFFGLTFETSHSADSIAKELDRRGILHNDPTVFMSITDSVLCKQNLGVGFIAPKDRNRNNFLKDSLASELKNMEGGPIGLIGVEEVQVGYTDEANLNKWQDFLKPEKQINKYVWRIGDSPAIRLIKNDIKEIKGIKLKVKSLEKAVKYLAEEDLLGEVHHNKAEIKKNKTFGLTIVLSE